MDELVVTCTHNYVRKSVVILSRSVIVSDVAGSGYLMESSNSWEIGRVLGIHGVRGRSWLAHPNVRVHGRGIGRVGRVRRNRLRVGIAGRESLIRRRDVHWIAARVELRHRRGVTTRWTRAGEAARTIYSRNTSTHKTLESFTDWFVDWLIDCLTDWLSDWLIDWLIEWLIG